MVCNALIKDKKLHSVLLLALAVIGCILVFRLNNGQHRQNFNSEIVNKNVPATPPENVPDHIRQQQKLYAKNLALVKAAILPPNKQRVELFPDQDPATYFTKSYSQSGQDKYLYLNVPGCNKTHGIFIEAGAIDGIFLSNTIYFEKYLHWSGLLVEADPVSFEKLKVNRPNTWRLNGCIGSHPLNIQTLRFTTRQHGSNGLSFVEENGDSHFAQEDLYRGEDRIVHKNVTCYPLNLILDAIGWTYIDYFSLDVEGGEPGILEAIDFDRFSFGVFGIECNWCQREHLDKLKVRNDDSYENTIMLKHFLKQHMRLKGYDEIGALDMDIFYAPKSMNIP